MAIMKIKLLDDTVIEVPFGKEANGYTPKKGTDYLTVEEKQEFINALISKVEIYNGEVRN